MGRGLLYVLVLLIGTLASWAQETVNQLDQDGKRHGLWKKYYTGTQQLRYSGTFDHGKEVGTFYFYCEDCEDQPAFIKEFLGVDNRATVTYFDSKGKVISKGDMIGKQREGNWVYYHKGTANVMLEERYVSGKLDGLKTTYYDNGNKTEELTYSAGLKNGKNLYYSPTGVLIKKLNYSKDQLQGPAEYYDATGALLIKGQYKNDAKDGLWYYYEDGKLSREERFPRQNKKQ